MITTWATLCQPVDPPLSPGLVGAVRSSRTVACTQFDVSPELSTLRNCTSVSPSADTATLAPDVGDVQVEPPSVDVSYW